jgi:hypothetical protein
VNGDGDASRLMSSGCSPADAATVSAGVWVAVDPDSVNAPISRCSAPYAPPRRIGGVGCGAMPFRRSQSGRIMPNRFAPGAQRAGSEAGIERANRIAAGVAPVIAELRAAGITSKKGLAKALNRRAVRTPRGIGEWRPIQVTRVLARLPV